jgi:hypothetical protein
VRLRRGYQQLTRRHTEICNPLQKCNLKLEARVGIEPTNAAFAEPCLTTWLPRHPLSIWKVN